MVVGVSVFSGFAGRDRNARRRVREAHRVVGLVSLLPARPGTAELVPPRLAQQRVVAEQTRRGDERVLRHARDLTATLRMTVFPKRFPLTKDIRID